MRRSIVMGLLAIAAFKIWLAGDLDLFGDEAFYWQCGQRPAAVFADHPPLTALLVRLGSELFGDSPRGVRSLFLLIGLAFPVAVFHLARPLVGHRDAWMAAGACSVTPAFAHLGLLAIPDVPMLFLATLFLLCFERATRVEARLRNNGTWLLAGLAGALGLLTHYRFVLAPLAAFVYLILTRQGRSHWRHRGPRHMALLMAVGLLPTVLYNLDHDFAPARYYLAGRHGTRFDLGNLLEHVATQMLLLTPLLFVALLVVLFSLYRRAAAGDDRATLLVIFTLMHLGVFLVTSPFEHSDLTTLHWPVPGYLALLPFLPSTLRKFAGSGAAWRRPMATLIPTSSVLILGWALVGLAGWIPAGSIRAPFTGWSQVIDRSRSYLADLRMPDESRLIVVADHYKLAAQLELALHESADLYILDHHKNHKHGRAPQFQTWGIDESGLARRTGQALAVVELSEVRRGEHDAWIAHVASFFSTFETLGDLRIDSPGKRKKTKHFRFYRGTLAGSSQEGES